VKNLIPDFIETKYKDSNWSGSVEACVMFVDISGFTPLTERLMKSGSHGAEELTGILNDLFSPLVALVYASGGFIPYFAGDAFTAIFPSDPEDQDTHLNLLKSALEVRDFFSEKFSKNQAFPLSIKIALSCGEVSWGIVGNQVKGYYFRGTPIDQSSRCQSRASEREIMLDSALAEKLAGIPGLGFRDSGMGCFQLELIEMPKLPPADPVQSLQPNDTIAGLFLPDAVVAYNQEGEFRPVITVFISFKGLEDHDSLNTFASLVMDTFYHFSGYFKEIDFGDKGGIMVGLFGAPVIFENQVIRALEFAMTLHELLQDLQKELSFKYKMGLTLGTAYTGLIGGVERCQYAAVGNRVNLSARLASYADWGEILVDEEIQKNNAYRFLHYGNIQYKGVKGMVPTYRLVGKNYNNRPGYVGKMINRDQELESLMQALMPIFDHKTAGLAFVFGEAGIGKSRLAYELHQRILQVQPLSWYTCQADQILKKPFNPYVSFLRHFFEQYASSPKLTNYGNFENTYQRLLERVSEKNGEAAAHILKELLRTKSILAALIGLPYKHSIWEQLDEKGKYQNTLAAVVNLFKAMSLVQPLVIELEDSQWLDVSSKDLSAELIRQIQGFPVFIIVTARYLDDGSRPFVVDPAFLTEKNIPFLTLDIPVLAPEALRSFASSRLGGPVTEDFFKVLQRSTNNNPFYLEQVLELVKDSGFLILDQGAWTLTDVNVKLSDSIHTIVTSRIDRFSALTREAVKVAAVIGREFELPILEEVLKTNEEFVKHPGSFKALVAEQIKIAERGLIWRPKSELRYAFRNSLIQEAAYNMQLGKRLQQLHRAIATAMERLYAGSLEERLVDLAFHFEKAGDTGKTSLYLEKAAERAYLNYQLKPALAYYNRLIRLSGDTPDQGKLATYFLKKGQVLEQTGDWEACREVYEQALNLARKVDDIKLLATANNSMGRLLMLKGTYFEANVYMQAAAGLYDFQHDQGGIARVYGDLGNLYFRQGKYDQALSFFEKSITLSKSIGQKNLDAQIVSNLGLTHMNRGKYIEGITCILEQLILYEQLKEKKALAVLYTNLAIIYFEKGDQDLALESYRKGLQLSEELGNPLLQSIATGGIGSVYERKGDYTKAMEHFQKDLKISEMLGDKQGIAISLGLIGELLSIIGEFHKAIEYLQKNLMLCESLNYQKGIAKALNTLGDVFFALQAYDRSIHFYDRAIEVTRRIDNKLVLGFSLAEKGTVLAATGDVAALVPVCEEALALSARLGNPDLSFEARLLKAKTEYLLGHAEAAKVMMLELIEEGLPADKEASVYFELFRINPNDDLYRHQALERYEHLYAAIPRFIFRERLELLKAHV
jgi:predicted ATPase/class 3 adenylate cyclase